MTNAATGNPMIPQHPQITAQRQAAPTQPAPASSNGTQPPQGGEPQSNNIDWNAIMLGMDDEVAPTSAPAAQPAQPGQPTQPQAGELTPEQKEQIARANMEQAQPPGSEQPSQPGMPLDQQMQAATQHLLNTVYKMTDEQKRLLISEPDKVIPNLAAQMHVTIVSQIGQYMEQYVRQMVPQLALSTMQRQMGAFRAEQSFFGQYPALANPQFKPVVLQALKFAKAFSPNATREQIMKDAAEMAAAKLKISLAPSAQQQPQQQQRQPHTPAQAPAAGMPFMPAAPGGAPAAQQAGQPSGNIFEELAVDPNW